MQALWQRLIGARDLIIESAPILAWRCRDPDATTYAASVIVGLATQQAGRPDLIRSP